MLPLILTNGQWPVYGRRRTLTAQYEMKEIFQNRTFSFTSLVKSVLGKKSTLAGAYLPNCFPSYHFSDIYFPHEPRLNSPSHAKPLILIDATSNQLTQHLL